MSDISSPPVQPHKRMRMIRKAWSKHYHWIADDGLSHRDHPSIYDIFVRYSRSKPTMTLHCGSSEGDKEQPGLACGWMIAATRNRRIGLGDFAGDPNSVVWEEFRQENAGASEFSWGMNLSSGRVNLKWKRTRHHRVDGDKSSARSWKLVDAVDNDHIVAIFTNDHGFNMVIGTLQINENWGAEFEYLVVISASLMYEPTQQQVH